MNRGTLATAFASLLLGIAGLSSRELVTLPHAQSGPKAPAIEAQVVVDGHKKRQVLDGVGVNINSLSWKDGEGRRAIDLLADQMGTTLWRVVFDMEDWEANNDNADPMVADDAYYRAIYSSAKFRHLWGTLHYLNQRNFSKGVAISFMGRVPPWMGGSVIDVTSEDEWVEMMATFVAYARGVEHVAFGMLDPLNETDWDGFEGPKVDAVQYARLLKKLAMRMDALGYGDVRFLGPNTADLRAGVSDYIPALMSDPVVTGRIDHFGLHSYGAETGGADEAIKSSGFPGKNFWMTEFSLPADVPGLLKGNASALIMWDGYDSVYNHALLKGQGDQPPNDAGNGPAPLSYDVKTGTYSPRAEFYQFAALFKFVPPGSRRIESGSSRSDLPVFAFTHEPSGRVTLTGHHRGSSAVTIDVSVSAIRTPAVMQVYTSRATELHQDGEAVVRGGRVSFVLPGNCFFAVTGTAK